MDMERIHTQLSQHEIEINSILTSPQQNSAKEGATIRRARWLQSILLIHNRKQKKITHSSRETQADYGRTSFCVRRNIFAFISIAISNAITSVQGKSLCVRVKELGD